MDARTFLAEHVVEGEGIVPQRRREAVRAALRVIDGDTSAWEAQSTQARAYVRAALKRKGRREGHHDLIRFASGPLAEVEPGGQTTLGFS